MSETVWIGNKLYSVDAILASGVKPMEVWTNVTVGTWNDVCYADRDGVRQALFSIDGNGVLNVPLDSPFILKDNLAEEAIAMKKVRDLCAADQRIPAIKEWRTFSKVGLKEAKDFVDVLCPPVRRF